MDTGRFDAMSRVVATGTARRQVLRLLAGGALASVGLVRVAAATEAKSGQACCAEKRKRCMQFCREFDRKLDNADFSCNPETCAVSIILCNCV